jgi:hypothetical protein
MKPRGQERVKKAKSTNSGGLGPAESPGVTVWF